MLAKNAVTLAATMLLVLTGRVAWTQNDADQNIRLLVTVERNATNKLLQELGAARRVGGSLVGYTREGKAVVQINAPSLQVAIDQVEGSEGIASVESEIPLNFPKPEELIVGYKPDERPAGLSFAGFEIIRTKPDGPYPYIVLRVRGTIDAQALERLDTAAQDDSIRYVEINRTADRLIDPIEPSLEDIPEVTRQTSGTVPNDPAFDRLWGMRNIEAPTAWDRVTGSGTITVAVIDTGVEYNHLDLIGNIWVNQEELDGTPGVDDDGNGYVDDIHGYDFFNNDGDPMDGHGHGTHCAGTIAAVGHNNRGVVGVNWQLKVIAVQIFSSGGIATTQENIALAIRYAVDQDARILSNSWGGGSYSQTIKDSITYAEDNGILFMAAAGNDFGNDNDASPHYPSSYNNDNIVAVLSTDEGDTISNFSSVGANSVDLGAPGGYIYSTFKLNNYKYLSGTSMATPHVAGAAALVLAHPDYNQYSGPQVRTLLFENVRDHANLQGKCATEGILNIGFLGDEE